MREGKRIQRERGIKYLHYTETGKVMTQVECHKLCVHNAIFREINKKTTQGDTLKNTTDKSKWGLPWWLSGKESVCQCRRCGFDPWVGKIPWKRKWQPAPVFLLAGISYEQRSLVSYNPWGHKRVRYDLATKQQQIKMDFLNVQGTPRRVEK